MRWDVSGGPPLHRNVPELRHKTARPSDPLDAREVTIEAMVQSAMRSAELAEECGLAHDRIILSAKVSGVQDLVAVYRRLAERSDYPRSEERRVGESGDLGGRRIIKKKKTRYR